MPNSELKNEQIQNDLIVNNESEQKAQELWAQFLGIIRLNVSELKLNTWFRPIKAKALIENTLTITVPSQDYYDMIISRFGDIVSKAIKAILGDDGKLVYRIEPAKVFSPEQNILSTVVIPYAKGTSEQIRKINSKFNIRTSFRTSTNLRSILTKVKPKK